MADTIFALATAPGRAAVAVIRISGPGSGETVRVLTGQPARARGMRLATLRDPAGGAPLDRALVLWFPGPASYTGEDVAELHLHGGAGVVDSVQRALLGLGLRLAEPGEFTRRAFENGKLDLSQAEGVADLIDAQTEAQRRQALAQLGGALAGRHAAWRSALVETLALLEANVDFPDEELPEDLAARARPGLMALAEALAAELADAARGERVRSGYRVALVGAPNAGKSSLLNALARRDAAIVTAIPGTTRDVIEVGQVLAGYQVIFLDTAGFRETADPVEVEGVRRARKAAEEADLRLWLVDGSVSDGAWRQAAGVLRPGDLTVLTKADLPRGSDADAVRANIAVSTATPEGLEALEAEVQRRVVTALSGADFPSATRERHRLLLVEALDHVKRAVAALQTGSELAAEDVRLAARALERITGRIGAEDVLDRVFSQFCIGK